MRCGGDAEFGIGIDGSSTVVTVDRDGVGPVAAVGSPGFERSAINSGTTLSLVIMTAEGCFLEVMTISLAYIMYQKP